MQATAPAVDQSTTRAGQGFTPVDLLPVLRFIEASAAADCSDSTDNDGDGWTDDDDAACHLGLSETSGAVSFDCSDGSDNDGDGATDVDDADCVAGWDTNEAPIGTCDDGQDDDSDGWLNWEEFVGHTVPSNSASYFRGITNMTVADHINLYIFPTSTSRIYEIEWSTNLPNGVWTGTSNAVPGTGNSLLFEITNSAVNLKLRGRVTVP